MMDTRWQCGDSVRVIRNVRNDGTYPGMATGAHLVRRGSIGHVIDVGTFLLDQIIYTVHFLDAGRVVGCREEELIDLDDEWIESRYETRERLRLVTRLALVGDAELPEGARGEVMRVVRLEAGRVAYQIHFEALPGRIFQLPEALLVSTEEDNHGSRLS